MKLLCKLLLIVSLNFINLEASGQNPILGGSFHPERQRSVSENQDSLPDIQFQGFGRSRSASEPTFSRKMVIEEVTNDTSYTLAIIDRRNLANSDKKGVKQWMPPRSAYQCHYEIKNSRDTPREYNSDEALNKEKLMHDAQFKIAVFDDNRQRLEGRSNYVNLAIVEEAIKVRHTHDFFEEDALRPLIIYLNRCKYCDCDPDRVIVMDCSDCQKSYESIQKGNPVLLAITLKMSEENRNSESGVLNFDYKCRMQLDL